MIKYFWVQACRTSKVRPICLKKFNNKVHQKGFRELT